MKNIPLYISLILTFVSTISCMEKLGAIIDPSKQLNHCKKIIQAEDNVCCAFDQIRLLGKKNPQWKAFLESKTYAGKLIKEASAHYKHNNLITYAITLRTPGAIEWGRRHLEYMPKTKESLQRILQQSSKSEYLLKEWNDYRKNITATLRILQPQSNSQLITTMLFNAIEYKCIPLFSLLIENYISDITTLENKYEYTPFLWAAVMGNNEALTFLINQNADCTKQRFRNKSALELAASYGNHQTVELLLKYETTITTLQQALNAANNEKWLAYSRKQDAAYEQTIQLLTDALKSAHDAQNITPAI